MKSDRPNLDAVSISSTLFSNSPLQKFKFRRINEILTSDSYLFKTNNTRATVISARTSADEKGNNVPSAVTGRKPEQII